MATIRFLLQSKSNEASIYIRLSLGRKNVIKRRTGLFVNHKEWSKETGFPKQNNANNKNLKSDLHSLQSKILAKLNVSNKIGTVINGDWLLNNIDLHFNRISEKQQTDIVQDVIQQLIESAPYRLNSRGSLGLSKSRVNAYKTLKNIFCDFQNKHRYRIKDVNQSLANSFLKYLINDKDYDKNYAIKKLADLKTVCYFAESNGVSISSQLKMIRTGRTNSDYIIYLNPNELKIIEKLKIDNEALINARKWLILGCHIGQRGGDLLKLTLNNFVNRGNLQVIELIQQKTNKKINIPVLDEAQRIIDNGFPYKISTQKLNIHFKEICRLANLNEMTIGKLFDPISKRRKVGKYPKWKLISSHVCRRSFATNLYGNLKTPLIMQITGHGTEKMLLNYIGKNSLDYAQMIADFYKSKNTLI